MDYSQIQAVIGMATAAAGMTGQAADAAQRVKGLFGGGKAPDPAVAQDVVNELAGKLTAANLLNLEISEALLKLSKSLEQEDELAKRKANYRLIKTKSGDLVYEYTQTDQPPHYVCPVCLEANDAFYFVRVSGLGMGTCQKVSSHNFVIFPRPPSSTPRVTR